MKICCIMSEIIIAENKEMNSVNINHRTVYSKVSREMTEGCNFHERLEKFIYFGDL